MDQIIARAFEISRDSGPEDIARAVLKQAGHEDHWDVELTDGAIRYVAAISEALAPVLWNDDKRVDVPGRAKMIAKELVYTFKPIEAPGILFAIKPSAYLPAGTIGELHRACRVKVIEETIPLVGKILRAWCVSGLLNDISRR